VNETLTCARCSDTGLDVARWAQRGWTPPDVGVCHGCGGPWPNPLPSLEAEQAAELARLRAEVAWLRSDLAARESALGAKHTQAEEWYAELWRLRNAADALREAAAEVCELADDVRPLRRAVAAYDRARGEP
jgi:hypothetical protein